MKKILAVIVHIVVSTMCQAQIDLTDMTVHAKPTIDTIEYVCNSGTVSVVINVGDTAGASYSVTSVTPSSVVIPPPNNTGLFDLTGSTSASFLVTNQYNCQLDTLVTFDCNDPLPISFISIIATLYTHNQAKIVWEVLEKEDVREYELLESADGITWSKISTMPSINANGRAVYDYIDSKLFVGNNFYKVIVHHKDNSTAYSPARLLFYQVNDQIDLVLYPNPTDGVISISLNAIEDDTLSITIYDELGRQVLAEQSYSVVSGAYSHRLDIGALSAATYIVRYSLPNNNMTGSIKVVKR